MAHKTNTKSRAAKAAAPKKGGKATPPAAAGKPVRREVGAVFCLLLGILTLFSCFGVEGSIITFFGNALRAVIGSGYYAMPFASLLSFAILMFHEGRPVRLRVSCAFCFSALIGALVHVFVHGDSIPWDIQTMWSELYHFGISGSGGGVLSGLLGMFLIWSVSEVVSVIFLIIGLLVTLLASLNMTIISIIRAIRQRPRLSYAPPTEERPDPAKVIVDHLSIKHMEHAAKKQTNPSDIDLPVDDPVQSSGRKTSVKSRKLKSPDQLILEQQAEGNGIPTQQMPEEKNARPDIPEEVKAVLEEEPQKIKKEEVQKETLLVAQEIQENTAEEQPAYVFPSLELLRSGDGKSVDGTMEMRQNTERLNDTLSSFGIDAHIVNVVRGPSVTRYEMELDPGVRLSRVTNLADDIALALGATGVRIAPIPDKISVVGIEVPNKAVSVVLAGEVIGSEAFEKSKSRITFAVGRDIGGNSIVGDIGKLPHMLIAGTTGSGKSVCMNSLIVSLLYKATPEQVRLIMIDPKMVELGVYNGIPHLLIPVVTDPKKAAGSLQWAVCEMMRRYRMMADAGVRELESYNEYAAHSGEVETMPQIVVVIDELADLMLVAAKEVEESICRIAQMGRAAGIHLVIATQRPSADVITGLMKANIPSRIAFAVASAMESRIILDSQGAEKLVGKGDMLYAPLGQGKPKRVQGCFITDGEVQRVVDFVSRDATANYDSEVIAQIEKNAAQSGGKHNDAGSAADSGVNAGDGYDELFIQAVDVILETGQASVSLLQRRLKLGYARAARIVDEMTEAGIVGPFSGSKPRELLVTKEQWEQMKNGDKADPVEEPID